MKETKVHRASCSMTASIPSLANNPYASLLDLEDKEQCQHSMSTRLAMEKSRQKGSDFRKVTFQRYGGSMAETRAMAAVQHDTTSWVQACPSLIMPDNLTVEEQMTVDHARHGHCGRTTLMCILKKHCSDCLPCSFVTLLNKFSCRFCQLALGARQYRKLQQMKQQSTAKCDKKSKTAMAAGTDTDSDSEV
eukprot:3051157-Rhodomonas_salina.2